MRMLWWLLKETFNEWSLDKAPRLGAALAYYTVFSLAPLLIVAIAIAGFVFGEQAARGEIITQLQELVGEPTASAIAELLKNTQQTGASSWAAVIGFAILFFGATGLFVQLQDALNTIWKVAPKPGRPVLSMARDRLVSFVLVLGTAFLMLLLLVVSAALAALSKFLGPDALPGGTHFWQVLNAVISFGSCTLLFGMLYKILPDARIAWRDVWVGAAVTALLFTAGKYLLGLYLGWSSTPSTFGVAASLVVILLWVYYSAQILLFGAEFTRVYANRYGSRVEPTENAIALSPEQLAREGIPRPVDLAKACAGRG